MPGILKVGLQEAGLFRFWLFWPYQIMEDIWRGTQNAIKERFGEPQSAAIVGWWWTLFLINNFFGYIIAFATGGAADVDELLTATKVEFVGDLISVAANPNYHHQYDQ